MQQVHVYFDTCAAYLVLVRDCLIAFLAYLLNVEGVFSTWDIQGSGVVLCLEMCVHIVPRNWCSVEPT